MILDEWKDKPKNKNFILLKEYGDKEKLLAYSHYYVAHNITAGRLTVYNTITDMMSEKSIYVDKSGKYYVKDSKSKKFFLEDFK